MYVSDKINTRMGHKPGTAAFIFLIAVALFVLGPLVGLVGMSGMLGDTVIQIKVGLDTWTQGHLILDEIYSWHEGLTWTAHETGWYILLGTMYKFFGLAGVIAVGCIFNLGTAFVSLAYQRNKAHPFIITAVMILLTRLPGFPDYNIRPSVTSAFMITLLIYVMLTSKSVKTKLIVFLSGAFALAWLHGGIMPIYFAVFIAMIVIEFVYKNFKTGLIFLASVPVAFLITLLNPIGIRMWTFGLKQAGASDIWAFVDEWQPKTFSIFEMFVVLLLFVAFMVDDRVRSFDKETITKLCIMSMFLIMTCVYKRFILLYTISYLMFGPEELGILIKWINDNIFSSKLKVPELSELFYKICAAGCTVVMIGAWIFLGSLYLPDNSITDIEKMAAYDHNVIDVLREKGYGRIYNSFNTGSWLLFNDIKIHIDNRIDPFMYEYSGVDHIRGMMNIDSIGEMDSFCEKYDVDAFVIDTYSSDPIVQDIAMNASDRYEVIYDSTVTSNIVDDVTIRWIIIECKH